MAGIFTAFMNQPSVGRNNCNLSYIPQQALEGFRRLFPATSIQCVELLYTACQHKVKSKVSVSWSLCNINKEAVTKSRGLAPAAVMKAHFFRGEISLQFPSFWLCQVQSLGYRGGWTAYFYQKYAHKWCRLVQDDHDVYQFPMCSQSRSLGGRKISTCTYVYSNIKNIADEGRLSDTTLYEHQSCISGTNEHPHFSDDNDPKSVPPGGWERSRKHWWNGTHCGHAARVSSTLDGKSVAIAVMMSGGGQTMNSLSIESICGMTAGTVLAGDVEIHAANDHQGSILNPESNVLPV